MSLYSAMLKRLGLIKEDTRGIAETTPDQWIYVTPDSTIDYAPNQLEDPTVKGVKAKYAKIHGLLGAAGTIKMPLQASTIGRFLDMLIPGDPVSSEMDTLTFTLGSNDAIDFKEDAGTELHAVMTAGTYPYGTTSATAGTVCALIKSILDSAGSGTYTVTYVYSTKVFSIAVAGSISAVQFLWKTGTSGSDNSDTSAASALGFTDADTSSSSPIASDSTTDLWAFTHAFTPSEDNEPQSYTVTISNSLAVKKYNLCNASQLKLARAPDQFINAEISIIAKAEATGSLGSPVYAESGVLGFQHDTFKIGGTTVTTAIKQWEITLTNGLMPLKVVSQEQTISNLIALENGCSGSFTRYFENETERDKFLAATETSLEIDIIGSDIDASGNVTYRLDLLIGVVQYTAYPFETEDDLLAAKVSWEGHYDATNSRVYLATLQNITSSY